MTQIYDTVMTSGETATNNDSHPVRMVAQEVTDGTGVDLIGFLTDPALPGYGLTPPDWSEPVMAVINEGALPFTMAGLDERAGDGDEGAAGVTAIHVLRNHVVRDTLKELVDSGQFEAAVTLFDGMAAESDPDPEVIAAYAVFRYAKGWLAEQLITTHDQFSKLGVSNDKGGHDFRYFPEGANRSTGGEDGQLKPVTDVASHGQAAFEDKAIPHWIYQWTADGIKWSRAERANEMNKAVKREDGLRSATILKKSENVGELKDYERPARLLWWPRQE